jgi:hypothetical protein
MTEKKGFLEKIFGKQESCCCGPKIVPKADAKKATDEKSESCSCCGPKIVLKTDTKKESQE